MTAPVLWVTAEVPDREAGGGNQRQAYLLIELARHRPVDLLVAGPVRDAAVKEAAHRIVEIDAAPRRLHSNRLARRAVAATTSWVARRPLDVDVYTPVRTALATPLRSMADGAGVVLVHHQALAPLVIDMPAGTARRVLHLFHASGDRSDQLAAVASHPLQRALLRRDGANARAVEQRAVDAADALVVATPQDARRLGRPGTPTHVVAQGVDLERFTPAPLCSEPTVVFSGSLDYDPNVDGLLWFASSIWPAVRDKVPAARLLVVGKSPVHAVSALDGTAGISVHADVPSMAPWLARARVAVAPLRVGTGVRVKALEALAAGLPIVGTTTAFEGIDVGPDEADVIDDPDGFAAAVAALLLDDPLASARRRAGRTLAETRLSWDSSGRQLTAALA